MPGQPNTCPLVPNNTVIIPNNKITQSILTNYYLPETRMAALIPISVSYEADPDHVERVLAYGCHQRVVVLTDGDELDDRAGLEQPAHSLANEVLVFCERHTDPAQTIQLVALSSHCNHSNPCVSFVTQ